jgi:hypothetical protein
MKTGAIYLGMYVCMCKMWWVAQHTELQNVSSVEVHIRLITEAVHIITVY